MPFGATVWERTRQNRGLLLFASNNALLHTTEGQKLARLQGLWYVIMPLRRGQVHVDTADDACGTALAWTSLCHIPWWFPKAIPECLVFLMHSCQWSGWLRYFLSCDCLLKSPGQNNLKESGQISVIKRSFATTPDNPLVWLETNIGRYGFLSYLERKQIRFSI